jgi:hypothetical protein
MEQKDIPTMKEEGLMSGEASSAATSAQSSASKDNIRAKFRDVPAGVEILADPIGRCIGLVVAHHVSKSQFAALADRNKHLNQLWLHNCDLIYTECVAHRVHNRLAAEFGFMVKTYNRYNEHGVHLDSDTDVLVDYGDLTARAGDVLITNEVRVNNGMQSPNIVGEIGYSSPLDRLTALAPIYLNDDPDNHTELYFALKLRYPYSIETPDQFQMVFLLYDRQHMPTPIMVVSCGTLPLSEEVRAYLEELTGISQQDHPDVHRGHGYGGPPCNAANGAHPHYTVTIGGARMVSLNRDGDLPDGLGDPDLYDFNISLFELQQVAVRALNQMALLGEGHTVQSEQDVQAALDAAAGEAAAVLTPGQVRARANHLCI